MNTIEKRSLYLCVFIFLIVSGCKKEKETGFVTDIPYDLLQEGDIVFRQGTGIVSHAVTSVDKKGSYSHIGIIVCKDSIWKVIHAVPGEPDFEGDPDRIKMEDIVTFFDYKRAKSGAITRLAIDSTLRRHAAYHAVRLFQTGILFDHNYNRNDTSQMYCTELIDYVYSKQGVDLTEGRISRVNIPGFSGDYLLPSDIQESNLLYAIYNF